MKKKLLFPTRKDRMIWRSVRIVVFIIIVTAMMSPLVSATDLTVNSPTELFGNQNFDVCTINDVLTVATKNATSDTGWLNLTCAISIEITSSGSINANLTGQAGGAGGIGDPSAGGSGGGGGTAGSGSGAGGNGGDGTSIDVWGDGGGGGAGGSAHVGNGDTGGAGGNGFRGAGGSAGSAGTTTYGDSSTDFINATALGSGAGGGGGGGSGGNGGGYGGGGGGTGEAGGGAIRLYSNVVICDGDIYFSGGEGGAGGAGGGSASDPGQRGGGGAGGGSGASAGSAIIKGNVIDITDCSFIGTGGGGGAGGAGGCDGKLCVGGDPGEPGQEGSGGRLKVFYTTLKNTTSIDVSGSASGTAYFEEGDWIEDPVVVNFDDGTVIGNETYGVSVYDASYNNYTLFIDGDVSITDIDAVIEIDGTNYTTTLVKNIPDNLFTHSVLHVPDLFTTQYDGYNHKWYYNVTFSNTTKVQFSFDEYSQTKRFGYGFNSFSMDASSYLEGETAIYTTVITNQTTLGTISVTSYLNNTSYTTSQSGMTFISSKNLPEIASGTVNYNTFSKLSVTYNGDTRITTFTPNETISVSAFEITDCSTGIEALVFNTYQEISKSPLNTTMVAFFEGFVGTVTKSLNITFSTPNTTHRICITPSDAVFNLNGTLEYKSTTAFPNRIYFITNLEVSNTSQTVSMYSLNDSFSDYVDITIRDENGELAEGITIKAQRWYLGDGVYNTIAMGKTGANGITSINLELFTAQYRFILERDGVVLKITNPTVISGDTSIIFTEEEKGDWFAYNNVISHQCQLNVTNYLICTVTDSTGSDVEANLLVREFGNTAWDTLCDVSNSGTSVSLPCLVGNITGRQVMYKLSLITENTVIILQQDIYETLVSIGWDKTGLFMTIAICFILFFLGINYGIDIALVMLDVGLATSYALGLLQIDLSALISMMMIVILAIVVRLTKP